VAAFVEKGGIVPAQYFRGAGCEECHQSGYKGRIGIYELLVMDDDLRELINHDHSLTALRRAAEDGLQKVTAGLTTVEEVMRVIAL